MSDQPLGPINLLLLVPPALAVAIAMRVLFGRARITPPDPMQVLLSVSSVTMFLLAVLGTLIGMSGLFFIPLAVIAVVLLLMVFDRTRRSEHRGLVWALAAAATRGIPLPEAARAYGDETPGRTGVRSLQLAEKLEHGQPLATAARSARLRMSTAMRLTVRMAESLGMLGPAMQQQIDDSQQIDVALRDVVGRLFYLATVVLFLQVVCTFIMLRIVPVFQRMFEEFGLHLPGMTLLVIEVSRSFGRYGWVFSVPLAIFVLPAFFIFTMLYYVGWFPRGLPIFWPLFRRYDGALVMRGLALAVRRAMPLPQALRLVEASYPLPIVAQRLHEATVRVEAGQDWCDSLRQTGLIGQADAAVLSAAQRVGNLDWALEEMASSVIRRQVQKVQVALNVLFPILLLTVGFIVFIFVCGLFIPLVALIQGLS